MILAVATVGYSQVKQVSRNAARPKAVERFIAPRADVATVMQNVQADPTPVRTEGTELDMTTYDWQSNAGPLTRTHVWADGKVDFAFTIATESGFGDRGTGLVTYNANTDEWSGMGARMEDIKTGFGTIAQYGENGLVIAAHTATDCRVFVVENRDDITAGSVTTTSILDPTHDPCWPNVMTSGPNRDIIHVIVTGNGGDPVPGMENISGPQLYFRSLDGGVTWDKQNVVLPYMTAEYGLEYSSNSCYWMETTEDNCLALCVNNAFNDGAVIYSYDDGETWNRKVFYSHPNLMLDMPDGDTCFIEYPRWASAVWSTNNELKIAYEWNATYGTAGTPSSSYYPSYGGVAYWGEDLLYSELGCGGSAIEGNLVPGQPFVLDTAYIWNDIYASMYWWSNATHEMLPEYIGYLTPLTDDGHVDNAIFTDDWESNFSPGSDGNLGNHATYNQGICAWPVLVRVPGSDDLVAVWSALDENCTDGSSSNNFYYHLFANYSPDGGHTWGNMVSLCGGEDYWMYENSEMIYPQAAIIGDQLIVVAQVDETPGSFVQSDDQNAFDNMYMGFTFSLTDLWGSSVEVPEISHNTKMVVSPNPATTQLNVNLNQDSEIAIYTITGQLVQRTMGHVGQNTINVSALNSGVYFINAGSDTQKFVVK